MPWVEALSDPQELRRCIRDLVALSTLPAIWTSYEPRQIAESIAAALVSMLSAKFVHVTLPSRRNWTAVDVTQTDRSIDAAALSSIRAALHGFTSLEAAGGFGMPRAVDRSFARLVDALDTALASW